MSFGTLRLRDKALNSDGVRHFMPVRISGTRSVCTVLRLCFLNLPRFRRHPLASLQLVSGLDVVHRSDSSILCRLWVTPRLGLMPIIGMGSNRMALNMLSGLHCGSFLI